MTRKIPSTAKPPVAKRSDPPLKTYEQLVKELGDPLDPEPHYKDLRPRRVRARRKPTTEEKTHHDPER